jgi:hypothetical protein
LHHFSKGSVLAAHLGNVRHANVRKPHDIFVHDSALPLALRVSAPRVIHATFGENRPTGTFGPTEPQGGSLDSVERRQVKTMARDQKSNSELAADEVQQSVSTLADETRKLAHPSDTSGLLARLRSVQSTLNEVYSELATWHEQNEPVTTTGRHDDPEAPIRMRAEVALREAAQYGLDASAALERARSAQQVELWFDELKVDE